MIIMALILMVVPLIFFFAFDFDSELAVFIELCAFIAGALIFLVVWAQSNSDKIQYAESLFKKYENVESLSMYYNTSFTGILKKSYKKQIDELLERKEMINKVQGLHNTAIKIPQRKKIIYTKKELQQVLDMLKNKKKYGY